MRYSGNFLLLLLIALFSVKGLAQQNTKIDSLMKVGMFEIYENPDKAIKIGKQVYELPESDIRTKINGLLMISDAYSSKRDYRKSLEYVIKAKNLSQKTDNPIIKMKILMKTAIQYQQLKIYDKAIQYLDEADKLSLNYPAQDSIQFLLGNNYTIRGFIYKEQLNCDIAIGYFDKGIKQYQSIKNSIKNANLSIVSYNKGNCYILLSDNEAAKKSFRESVTYAKNIDAKSLQAFAQKGLAEVYTLEGKYTEAIAELTEAVSISDDVGDLVLNQGLYKGLSENYLAVNEWANYQKYQRLYLMTQQRIRESERKSISDSLNEQQQSVNGRLETIKSKYVYAIVFVAILALLALVLIAFNHKKAAASLRLLHENIKKLQQKA